MAGPIFNASSRLLSQNPGTLPDVSGALFNWFQPLTFITFVTTVVNFNAQRVPTEILSSGVIQPFTAQRLMLKPEGERKWKWKLIHALPNVIVEPGDDFTIVDVVNGNTSFRCMGKKDWKEYGYVEYEAVEDYSE